MKNLRLKSVLNVPIYDLKVYLFVSLDAEKTYRRARRAYGFPTDTDGFGAMTVSDDSGAFGMFFHADNLTQKWIGHEINHLTRLIMEYIGHTACSKCKNDEKDAHLCGYLHEWVKKKLAKAHIRVS